MRQKSETGHEMSGGQVDEVQGAEKVSMETTRRAPLLLTKLVERFRVCWQVWPEYIFVGREKRQIGFMLELCGTHEPGVDHPAPGCPHCQRVFVALQAIADGILPHERRASKYEIEPYRQAISYSRARGNRSDVTLTIRILHREGFEGPVDECEVRCLKEMKQRLKELGACEGQWATRKR